MSGPIVLVIILIVLAMIVFSIIQSSKRMKELQEFASAHRLAFSHTDMNDIPETYSTFVLFKGGHSKSADNLCYGSDKGLEVLTCDYKYTVGGGKNSHTDYFTVFILKTPILFRPIYLRPENFIDKIEVAVGFDDINFESVEFSKTFHVKSTDKKFAYDIFHPRMMELFLSDTSIYFETQGPTIMMYHFGTMTISQMELLLTFAHQFMELIPGYLRKDMDMKVKGN